MKTKPQVSEGTHIAHVSILHDESSSLDTYEGVEIRIRRYYQSGRDFRKTFNSGDITCDFPEALMNLLSMPGVFHMSLSSSCDHFVMDVDGFRWCENDIIGSFIIKESDDKQWHRIVRHHGKNKGRDVWIQGARKVPGHFIVLDNIDKVAVIYPDGEILPKKKLETPQDAMDFCSQAKRKVIWE